MIDFLISEGSDGPEPLEIVLTEDELPGEIRGNAHLRVGGSGGVPFLCINGIHETTAIEIASDLYDGRISTKEDVLRLLQEKCVL